MLHNMPATHSDDTLKCGQCQWYTAGYAGDNCQKLRGVELDTPACVEYVPTMKDAFHEIGLDKYVQGIRRELLMPKYKIQDKLLDELKSYIIEYHFEKKDMGNSHDILKMQEYLSAIVSNRSRISTIYAHAIDLSYDIEALIDKLQLWVYAKYDIMRELKNEGLRKAAFNRLIPEYVDVMKNLNKLTETAKYIDRKLQEDEGTIRAVLGSAEKLWFSRTHTGQRV